MFKLFQKLFGHKPVPTPPKEYNLAASSFDIAELVKDSLVSIYEKENGRPATESEKKHIRDAMDGIINTADCTQFEDFPEDEEVLAIQRQDTIERIAHGIRLVVVCFVELLNEPYPYKAKKDIPLIREGHSKVMTEFNHVLYGEAVAYAYHDMFEGESRLIEDHAPYKAFFSEYTKDPSSLNLYLLRDAISQRYETDIDDTFFSL